MRNCLLAVITLAFLSGGNAIGQTPGAAQKYFRQGNKDLAQGNLESAIENYSRAIEFSSRLTKPDSSNSFAATEANNIRVIDPITAHAYTNRGIVRYRRHDLDGAISDFSAAIRISPLA